MRKSPHTTRKKIEDAETHLAASAARLRDRVPLPIRSVVAGFLSAPIIGVTAGFLLLFSGIFLGIAWQLGVQPFVDSAHFASYTAHADAQIAESWVAMEFDPDHMPSDTLYWQPRAKIGRCVVVGYTFEATAYRRAFCGNHFDFRDDFSLLDLDRLAPEIPVTLTRDDRHFISDEIRLTKPALDWLSTHAPHSTFMLSKPPPTTALAALHEQVDRPAEMAIKGWSAPIMPFALAFDPKEPASAMPAGFVEQRREAPWLGGIFFAVLLAVPGFYVWRIGVIWLFGNASPLTVWLLTAAPLLALPAWDDTLPALLRHIDKDWAMVATDMLDDLSRTTRLHATQPADAALAGGERIFVKADQGYYADTFGKIPFRVPQPAPPTAGAAITQLMDQISAHVATLPAPDRAALFDRLKQLKDASLSDVQYLFAPAAEMTLRDAGTGPAAHASARRFLLFASGNTYYEDRLDVMENAGAETGAK